jgi:metal-responsive CopG/Arc/MetJ family transcriptional regulator
MGRKKLDRERINITLPKGMADALAEAAKERGWDRSRLIEELAVAYLRRRERVQGT